MYSVVLMAALTAGGQTPNCHGCHASYGGCYGSCYGNYGLEGYGGCCNSGCGSSYTCGGGYGSCWGSGYGSCWGAGYGCYGSYYPWDYSSSGCAGCAGFAGCDGYGGGSPYFATPPVYGPPAETPVEPPVKGEPIPAPMKGAAPEGMAPTNARLIVAVPAGADLYIDDHKMKTQSERRTFQTPELEPGQTYFYEVRVEVERDGKTLSTTKRVLLKAGQEVRADFNDMDATVTAKAK